MPDAGTSFTIVFTSGAVSAMPASNMTPNAGYYVGLAAQAAFITLETADIRYHICGLSPAASCGHILYNGDTVELHCYNDILNFKGITTGAGVVATAVVTLEF